MIMNHHPADAAGEARCQFHKPSPALLFGEIPVSREVDNDRGILGGTELQAPIELFGSGGMHLGAQPGLLKAKTRKFHQAIVAFQALLKEAQGGCV